MSKSYDVKKKNRKETSQLLELKGDLQKYHTLIEKNIYFFIILVFLDIFNKIVSTINVLERI